MKYLIPIILLLLITPALADSEINLQELKTSYNQNLDKVPWIVKVIIGDEKINLYYTNNEQTILGIITENAKIISIQEGKIENPTLNIYITENIINKLKNQEITIQQALDNNLIKYESQRIRTSIKIWLVNLFT